MLPRLERCDVGTEYLCVPKSEPNKLGQGSLYLLNDWDSAGPLCAGGFKTQQLQKSAMGITLQDSRD